MTKDVMNRIFKFLLRLPLKKNYCIIPLKGHHSLLTNSCLFGQHSKCYVVDEVTEYQGETEEWHETDCGFFGPITLRKIF